MLAQLGALAGSFFCKWVIPDQRDPGRELPSIAYTLARVYEPYRASVVNAIEAEPDIMSNSLTYQLFLTPFAELNEQ